MLVLDRKGDIEEVPMTVFDSFDTNQTITNFLSCIVPERETDNFLG